jgi:hypothetical protein
MPHSLNEYIFELLFFTETSFAAMFFAVIAHIVPYPVNVIL